MKIVLANGCFDLLHVGHLKYLEAARALGDYLVVAVTRDRSVNKGEGRPAIKERERAALLRGLRCVQRVILVDSSLEALYAVWPQVFVKGEEYKRRIRREDRAWCKQHDCEIVFTPKTHSSSAIYDRIRAGR